MASEGGSQDHVWTGVVLLLVVAGEADPDLDVALERCRRRQHTMTATKRSWDPFSFPREKCRPSAAIAAEMKEPRRPHGDYDVAENEWLPRSKGGEGE